MRFAVTNGILLVVLAKTFSTEQPRQQGQPVVVPDALVCANCQVTTKVLATVGPREGAGLLEGQPFQVSLDSRNRIWVSPNDRPPMIYDSTGKFLRVLGATGDGPGEYRGPVAVVSFGSDSILAMDLGKNRAAVLKGDLTPARTITLNAPGQLGHFALAGKTLFASGSVPTPASAALPLHTLSIGKDELQVVKSTGTGSAGMIRGHEHLFDWRISSGRNRTLWSAEIREYRVAQWSESGNMLKQLIRRPAWFKDSSNAAPINRITVPPPIMADIAEDSDGLIWVAVLTASETWKEGYKVPTPPPPPPGSGRATGEGRTRLYDLYKLYGTTVEVIDPSVGKVVTSFGIKQHVLALLSGRRAAVYTEGADGYPALQIVQFTLARR